MGFWHYASSTMTFLNPLALFGLAAAAIPILIHLLNVRKLKIVEFSSLRFLKELQKTRMRRLKLRQWLILLFRTFLIIFLIFAFSRPALRGSLAGIGGGQAASTVAVLLDDSPTMGMRNDRGVLFQQAKDAVAQLLNTTTGADELYLFRLSDSYDPSARPLPVTPSSVLKALGGMTVSQRSRPYQSFVARGLEALAASRSANKELYLVTDGQGTQFLPADTAGLTNLPESKDVGVFLMEIPPAQRENGAASSLTVESRLLSPQRPIQFRGTVANLGDRPIANAVASLYLDGARVAQQSITVAPHATTALLMSAAAKRRGIIGASLHIDDDAFGLDNDRYEVVRIPERIAVACISSNPADTRFPASAFSAAMDSTQAGLLKVLQITSDRMQPAEIRDADLLVLSNIVSLTPAQAAAIAAEVRSGKGLILFPGGDTDYKSLNAGLLAALGIPAVTPPDLRQLAPDRTGFLSFSAVEYKHPVFEGMFAQDPGRRGTSPAVQSPRIRAAVGLQTGTTGYPVITMSNGAPFLCEYTSGKGKILFFSVESGTAWSDFPYRGLFAPLLYRSALYLASQHDAIATATVGERLRFALRMPAEESGKAYVVKSPSGNDERVQPEHHAPSGMTVYQTAPSEETGLYALVPAESTAVRPAPKQAIGVNSVAAESDLSRVKEAPLAAFWARAGISTGNVRTIVLPADMQRIVAESRYGTELWRHFIILALACALVEMALSRAGRSTVSPEEHASHGQ
jgi:hypothetical protein